MKAFICLPKDFFFLIPLKHDVTFFCSLVIAVLEGARPPGAPRRHLAVDGTGDLAELGRVGDGTLAQLVFHGARGCANEPK